MALFVRFRPYILDETRNSLTDGELNKIDEFLENGIIYNMQQTDADILNTLNFEIVQKANKFQIIKWPHDEISPNLKKLHLQVLRRNPRQWKYQSIFHYEIGDNECKFKLL